MLPNAAVFRPATPRAMRRSVLASPGRASERRRCRCRARFDALSRSLQSAGTDAAGWRRQGDAAGVVEDSG